MRTNRLVLIVVLLCSLPILAKSDLPSTPEAKCAATQQFRTDTGSIKTHDTVDWINACSTGVIAVFTILLFVGIFYQVKNTRDVERAWIVMKKIRPPKELSYHQLNQPTILSFVYTITNRGRTPARVIAAEHSFELIDSTAGFPEIPAYEAKPTDSLYPGDGLIIVPKDVARWIVDFAAPDDSKMINNDQLSNVKNGTSIATFYGFIRYFDAFSREHECRFCWVYDPKHDQFKTGGPDVYNRHT